MRNFVIVGTYRTGSSALAESLGLYSNITCGWEWMHGIPPWKKTWVAQKALGGDFTWLNQNNKNHMDSVFKSDCENLGFRCLFSSSNKWLLHPRFAPALWVERLEGHLKWIAFRKDISIIHVVRSDAVDWLKSVYLAKKSGYYVSKGYPGGLKVTIPLKEAVARLKTKRWIDCRLGSLKDTIPYRLLKYENFLSDNQCVIDSTVKFLGSDSVTIEASKQKIHKQSKGPASDYISNYDDLCITLEKLGLLRQESDNECRV